jgi:hypothetical protein
MLTLNYFEPFGELGCQGWEPVFWFRQELINNANSANTNNFFIIELFLQFL